MGLFPERELAARGAARDRRRLRARRLLEHGAAAGARAFSQDAGYLFDEASRDDAWSDVGRRTLECTKRMMSLHLYAMWKAHGTRMFAEHVDARTIAQVDAQIAGVGVAFGHDGAQTAVDVTAAHLQDVTRRFADVGVKHARREIKHTVMH